MTIKDSTSKLDKIESKIDFDYKYAKFYLKYLDFMKKNKNATHDDIVKMIMSQKSV